jgi:hypothetical protein
MKSRTRTISVTLLILSITRSLRVTYLNIWPILLSDIRAVCKGFSRPASASALGGRYSYRDKQRGALVDVLMRVAWGNV